MKDWTANISLRKPRSILRRGRGFQLALGLAFAGTLFAAPGGGGTTTGGGPTPGGGRTPAANTNLDGFAGVTWGAEFKRVKEHIRNLIRSADSQEKVEIISEERNKFILVKRNDVLYRYNFYKTPLSVERIKNHRTTLEEHDMKEAVFYHIKVSMPLIAADMVKGRLEEKYGRAEKSTVDKKTLSGANIWNLAQGLIFQWSEPYKKKAFTRDIDYLSKELTKKIMDEYAKFFDARERRILKRLRL